MAGKSKGKWEYYEVSAELKRLKVECPRCGPGVYMAEHRDRVSCGRCGYTEFRK